MWSSLSHCEWCRWSWVLQEAGWENHGEQFSNTPPWRLLQAHLQAPAMMSLRDRVWLWSYKLKQSLSPPSLWPWCFIKATEILTKTDSMSLGVMQVYDQVQYLVPSPAPWSCSLLHGWCDSHKKLISFIIINTRMKLCMEEMHCQRLFLVFLARMVVGTRGRKQTSPSR